MSEQLELDMKRNILVQEGSLTRGEADDQAQEWEKVRTFVMSMLIGDGPSWNYDPKGKRHRTNQGRI
jgi:hypothetical protein